MSTAIPFIVPTALPSVQFEVAQARASHPSTSRLQKLGVQLENEQLRRALLELKRNA